jgi:multidrug efflux pump
MVIASGASAKSQQALGTVVMGGMIAVVILALLMVPVFFTVVQRTFSKKTEADLQAEAAEKESRVGAGAALKPAP